MLHGFGAIDPGDFGWVGICFGYDGEAVDESGFLGTGSEVEVGPPKEPGHLDTTRWE